MNEPLRVLHLTSSKNRSGGTRQAVVLAQGQQEAGLQVCFVGVGGAAVLEMARAGGVPTRELVCRGWKRALQDSLALRRTVRELGSDIVHTHHTRAQNLALMASLWGTFPPIVVNRGVLFAPEFPAKFRSRRNAAFITNSEAVKRTLVRVGVNAGKVHVVYNGVRTANLDAVAQRRPELLQELRIDPGKPVVGVVGRGRPEKGFQVLVEAAPRILRQHPETTFVLVGSGTEHLREPIHALGLDDRFRLTGHRSDVVAVMGLFTVFAIPSLDMDSCPNVLLEAMSVGLPAVGSDVGGIPELIVEGENGRVVPAGDPVSLSEAIIGLLSDPDEAARMGKRGRDRALQDFTVQAKVQNTVRVYQSILRGASR